MFPEGCSDRKAPLRLLNIDLGCENVRKVNTAWKITNLQKYSISQQHQFSHGEQSD